MKPVPLTPEEDELLYILEGRQPQDFERFHSLVALLMERHWCALVTHIDKRCFSAGSSMKDTPWVLSSRPMNSSISRCHASETWLAIPPRCVIAACSVHIAWDLSKPSPGGDISTPLGRCAATVLSLTPGSVTHGAHTRADRGSRAFLRMALAMLSLSSGNT